jgi:hypothetical protein
MLIAGSVAFGLVAGWCLGLRPRRPAPVAAVVIAVAATAWLAGDVTSAPAAIAGVIVGAALHLALRRAIAHSISRQEG